MPFMSISRINVDNKWHNTNTNDKRCPLVEKIRVVLYALKDIHGFGEAFQILEKQYGMECKRIGGPDNEPDPPRNEMCSDCFSFLKPQTTL